MCIRNVLHPLYTVSATCLRFAVGLRMHRILLLRRAVICHCPMPLLRIDIELCTRRLHRECWLAYQPPPGPALPAHSVGGSLPRSENKVTISLTYSLTHSNPNQARRTSLRRTRMFSSTSGANPRSNGPQGPDWTLESINQLVNWCMNE